jgi:hypothetical protein
MADLDDITKKIVLIGALLGAIVIVLNNLAKIYRELKPFLAFAVFLYQLAIKREFE